MTVVDDLTAAKAAIEEKGWHQGGLTNGQGLCAVGALNLACTGSLYPTIAQTRARRNAAHDALGKHLPEQFVYVADFNDDPFTTKQDVLDLFEKTLADLGGLA